MWYDDCRKRILIDAHLPEWHDEICSRFDAGDMVARIVATGAEVAFIHAKPHTGYALFKTEVGQMNRALKGRDVFGEFVAEARKQGLRVGAYYSITWDNCVFDKHPEWRMLDNKGADLGWDPLFYRAVCYLSSGYRRFIHDQVKELAANYDIDGFWFDILLFDSLRLGCYCEGCKKRFRDRTGREMPTEPTWDATWRDFLEFRYGLLEDFAEETIRVAKGVKPQITVGFNYHGTPGFGWKSGQRPVQHAGFCDYTTGEIYPYCFGFLYPGMLSKYLAGIHPDKTSEILTNMYVHSADYSTKPTEQVRWEAMASLANGSAFGVWDELYHDGTVNDLAFERIGDVFREVDEKKELWGGEPVRDVGVYFSAKSRDHYGREKIGDYTLSFYGAYKALFELHRQVGFLFDETASLETFKAYPILLLPNTAILDDDEVQAITRYVEEGGNLVATGDTGLYDRDGQLSDYRLAHLFGASFERKTDYSYNYVSFNGDAMGKGIHPGYRILCLGKGSVVKATADTAGKLWTTFYDREPDRYFLGIHPPHEVVGPAVVMNSHGRGRVVFCPFRLLAGYGSEHAVAELRTLLGNILDGLGHEPPIRVKAPLTVEVVIREQPDRNRSVIHLVGFNGTLQSIATAEGGTMNEKTTPLMEEPPLYRAQIRIGSPHRDVRAYNSDTTIARLPDDVLEVTCNHAHEAIIVER